MPRHGVVVNTALTSLHAFAAFIRPSLQLVNKEARREQGALDSVLGDIKYFEDANREAVEAKRRALARRQRDAERCTARAMFPVCRVYSLRSCSCRPVSCHHTTTGF